MSLILDHISLQEVVVDFSICNKRVASHMLHINPLKNTSYNNTLLVLSLFFACLFLSLFSPMLSYFITILLMVLFNKELSRLDLLRYSYVLVVGYSLLLIYASRSFESELNHDLSRYFYEYVKMAKMDIDEYDFFGGGLEFGYHVLYTAIAFFLPDIGPVGLAICNVAIVFVLFYI